MRPYAAQIHATEWVEQRARMMPHRLWPGQRLSAGVGLAGPQQRGAYLALPLLSAAWHGRLPCVTQPELPQDMLGSLHHAAQGAVAQLCKLAVLPGARLYKLALHYSRVAEPSHPGTCFSGLSVARTLSAGPVRSKGWVQDLHAVGADWFLQLLTWQLSQS